MQPLSFTVPTKKNLLLSRPRGVVCFLLVWEICPNSQPIHSPISLLAPFYYNTDAGHLTASSVADPEHFGTDPDPRIHTCD
jgi:hypothetical protein